MCPLFTIVLSIIVTMSIGVPVLCVLAFVPLWIAQMFTGLVPCVNHCARVLFIRGTPHTFVLGFYPVFCYVFVWSLSRSFTQHAVIWVCIKNLLRIPAPVSQIMYASVTVCSVVWLDRAQSPQLCIPC
jgi:hypothetical protein